MLRRRDACLEPTLPGRSLRQGQLEARQLGSCSVWLTAEKGIVLGGGSSVATWEDQGKSNLKMVASGAYGLPDFSNADATFRSMPAVEFSPAGAPNGADRLISQTCVRLIQPNTIAVVFQNQKSKASDDCGYIHGYGTGGSAANQINFTGDAGGTKHTIAIGAGSGLTPTTTTTYALNVGRSMIGLFNNGTGDLWVDGVRELSGETLGTANFDVLMLGDFSYADDADKYFDGKIAEFAVWDRALTAGEIQAVTDAWAAKYGVAQ